MVTIPNTRDDRRPTPSGYSAVNRPTVVADGRDALGAGLQQSGDAALNVADDIERTREQQDAFEVQRRFQQFEAEQRQSFVERQAGVDPRHTGFKNVQNEAFRKDADEFFRTIPDGLRPQYNARIFQVESGLDEAALQYEREARRSWLDGERADGLSHIEGKIFANPGDYEASLAEGLELINNIPDDVFTTAEKLEFARQWEDSTRLAVLNGVTPQERIRLLGGIQEVGSGVDAGTLANANRMKPEIKGVISEAAARYGVPTEAMLVVAWLESKGNPSAKNPKSSAEGLFQQVSANAQQYGVTDPSDAAQSADGAARFMRDNTAKLKRVLGREPTVGELYLAHQQGPGGAIQLLTNPDALAVDLVGKEEVELNGGTADMTAGEFAQIWLKKAGDTHIPDGGIMRAVYNPEQADSRFTDIAYDDAQSIIATAQKAIGDEFDAQAKQEEYERAVYSAQLGIAVTAGDATQQDVTSALKSGLISPQRYEALSEQIITQGRKSQKDTEDLQSLMTRIESGGSGNSYSDEDRNAANQIDGELQEKYKDDPQVLGEARIQVIRDTNVAPKEFVVDLLGGMDADDPAAYDLGARALALAPDAFNGVQKGSQVKERVEQYKSLTHAGLSKEGAAKRLSPSEREKYRRDAVSKEVTSELSNIGTEDILDHFDTWAPFDRPSVSFETDADLQRDFGVFYRIAREDGLQPKDAEAHAARMLVEPGTGLYGFSNIGMGTLEDHVTRHGVVTPLDVFETQRSIMRLPVEHIMPAIGPRGEEHQYVLDDVQASLKEIQEYKGGHWFLDAEPGETEAFARARANGVDLGLPGYLLWYEQEDGRFGYTYWRMTREQIDNLRKDQSAEHFEAGQEESERQNSARRVQSRTLNGIFNLPQPRGPLNETSRTGGT